MMSVEECIHVVDAFALPTKDFIGWDDDEKNAFCLHYYKALDWPIYEYNPYSQGYLLCESLGIPKRMWDKKIRDIQESFEMKFECKIEELLKIAFTEVNHVNANSDRAVIR